MLVYFLLHFLDYIKDRNIMKFMYFFTIDGEEAELTAKQNKKVHRSRRRDRRGKHKARRQRDSEFPTPYDTASSRIGGEDVYGLDSGASSTSGFRIAGGKKKRNKKHPQKPRGR